MEDLKINLIAARHIAELTQIEAAKRLGVSNKTLSFWENKKKKPTKAQQYLISKVYNIDIKYLIF